VHTTWQGRPAWLLHVKKAFSGKAPPVRMATPILAEVEDAESGEQDISGDHLRHSLLQTQSLHSTERRQRLAWTAGPALVGLVVAGAAVAVVLAWRRRQVDVAATPREAQEVTTVKPGATPGAINRYASNPFAANPLADSEKNPFTDSQNPFDNPFANPIDGSSSEPEENPNVFSDASDAFSKLEEGDSDMAEFVSPKELKFVAMIKEEQMRMKAEQHAATIEDHLRVLPPVTTGNSTPEMELYAGRPRPQGLGYVQELYTFGAPGVAAGFSLYDPFMPKGCIPGLRVYTTAYRYTKATGAFFAVADAVSWITEGLGFHHAKMDVLGLSQANDFDNRIHRCSEGDGVNLPIQDNFWWINGHLVYPKFLKWHLEALQGSEVMHNAPDDLPPIRRLASDDVSYKITQAQQMAHAAFMNYRKTPAIGIDAGDWRWTMVGRACSTTRGQSGGIQGLAVKPTAAIPETLRTWVPGCKDHVILYQNNDSLACTLVFEGSDDLMDWLSNFNTAPWSFCGFGKVHGGFRAKLFRMIGGIDYAQVIREKLPYCAGLTVAGHSLGGAQAELFSACANRALDPDHVDFNDYRLCSFRKGRAKRLPGFFEDHAPGFFIKNKGNGLCIDVKGTAATDYKTPVIACDCEFPTSNYSRDQRWTMTAEGFIVNGYSEKCIDARDALTGGVVRQRTCEFGSDDTYQQWVLNSWAFLENKKSGKCLAGTMKLYECPFPDQTFEFEADGHLKSKLSGLCLDVKGSPGTAIGSPVIIWQCEHYEGTDQLWELTPEGDLRNKRSGFCANPKSQQGRENRPNMVLGYCNSTKFDWTLKQEGYIMSQMNGKCLNIQGKPGIVNGTRVNINYCERKTVNTDGLWRISPGGFIKNIGNDKPSQYQCIDVLGTKGNWSSEGVDGAPLHLDYCRIVTDQRWEVTRSGYIRNVIGGRKCLAPTPGSTSLRLMNCAMWSSRSTYLEFKFVAGWHDPRGKGAHIRSRLSRLCLTFVDADFLQLLPCAHLKTQGDSPGQKWRLTPDGFFVSQVNSKCLTVGDVAAPDGKFPLVLRQCTPGLAGAKQTWNFTGNQMLVNTQTKLCAQTVIDNYRNGQGLKMVFATECPIHDQRWDMLPGGQIKNRVSKKCLDLQPGMPGIEGPDWNMKLLDCDSTRSLQRWERVIM